MAQKDAIKRQTLIIKLLRRAPRSFKEISNYLEIESEIQSFDLNISQRTFQRDLKEIEALWGVEIAYKRSSGKYAIVYEELDTKTERLMESFDIFNSLRLTERISEFIHFEDRIASGSDLMIDFLTAIKNRTILTIHHKKYWDGETTVRNIEPYALKEYRYRWYIVANDKKDNKIKTFGLDRISLIVPTQKKFTYPESFKVNEYFKYSYGVIGSNGEKPQNIELSFTAFQGRYIKTLPMHHTQKILVDNDKEFRVSLKLVPTLDFIMDITQYADEVKVLKPKWLADEIIERFTKTVEQYK